jgi:hypothetical protein
MAIINRFSYNLAVSDSITGESDIKEDNKVKQSE